MAAAPASIIAYGFGFSRGVKYVPTLGFLPLILDVPTGKGYVATVVTPSFTATTDIPEFTVTLSVPSYDADVAVPVFDLALAIKPYDEDTPIQS